MSIRRRRNNRPVGNIQTELGARVMPIAQKHIAFQYCRSCVTLQDAIGHVTHDMSFDRGFHWRKYGISAENFRIQIKD